MSSYEDELKKSSDKLDKVDISFLKYFWQANPISFSSEMSVPKFLRKLKVLKNFSDNDLRIFSKYLHIRKFQNGEKIFRQNQAGVGCYFIYSGNVDIYVEDLLGGTSEESHSDMQHVVTLDRFDYFGELALLQENSVRTATAIAQNSCVVLVILKPDVDEMITEYPIVAARFLQSISLIISNRLYTMTNTVRTLKYKVAQLEAQLLQDKKD